MPFQKGHAPMGGRQPAERERKIWDILDNEAIPAAIRHLYAVVTGTDPDTIGASKSERVRLKNEAAKALLNKAPERLQHTGSEGAPLFPALSPEQLKRVTERHDGG